MSANRENTELFLEIVSGSLERAAKFLPKKHADLINQTLKSLNDLKSEKTPVFSKLLSLFRPYLALRIVKIYEVFMQCVEKLTEYFPQECSLNEGHVPLDMNLMIELMGHLPSDPDDSFYANFLKLCLCVTRNSRTSISNSNLLSFFTTMFSAYWGCKTLNSQNGFKDCLKDLISFIFRKYEESLAVSDSGYNSQTILNGLESSKTPRLDKRVSVFMKSMVVSESVSPGEKAPAPPNKCKTLGMDTGDESTLRSFLKGLTGHLVDEVCLYSEKLGYLEQCYLEMVEKGVMSKGDAEEKFKTEKGHVSVRSVEPECEGNEVEHHKIIPVFLKNEVKIENGKYGWCFICRKPANLYCKSNRLPICSSECRSFLSQDLYVIDKAYFQSQNRKFFYLECLSVFKILITFTKKELNNAQNELKQKILATEVLSHILQHHRMTLQSNRDFLDVVKYNLTESLLKNLMSTDPALMTHSFSLFTLLALYYREHLKGEIFIVIDQICLKLIDSGNSLFIHRQAALHSFSQIFKSAKAIFEFYVNYDCDVGSDNLFEKVTNALARIAQGKYSKAASQLGLQPAQDLELRTLALESLVEELRLVSRSIEENEVMETEDAAPKEEIKEQWEEESMQMIDQKIETFENVEKARSIKLDLQTAVQKFNVKPKLGILFLVSHNYITEKSPADLANFLFTAQNLSKEKLGEFFGDEATFNLDVLAEYTRKINFSNMHLDDAIRSFLSHFTLPGESQKVDRIMERFAESYHAYNKHPLKSACAAYTLSYLLIMLQTDLHNPQVKDKMKPSEFMKLARGINDGEDLPIDYMTGLYNRIQKEPLALHEMARVKKAKFEALNNNLGQKKVLFTRESEMMLEKGKAMIQSQRDTTFISVAGNEYAKPVAELLWSPCLASFSVLLEENNDLGLWGLCVEGLTFGFKLMSNFNNTTEMEAFMRALAKFTSLNSIKDIKLKNIICVKGLLSMGLNQGLEMKHCWFYVLDCVSRLDHLNVICHGGKTDSDIFQGNHRNSKTAEEKKDPLLENLIAQIDPSVIDKIFNRSVLLDGESILEFINCLCKLSEEELKNSRVFCLQRIVEVTDLNMDRIKIIWSKIWHVLQAHFTKAGCHSNSQIAIYAIDSLKQLAKRFLKKGEANQFEYQKEFLQPFENIFQQSGPEIKEFILCIMLAFSQIRFKELRSGWKVIFNVIEMSLISESETLIKTSFEIINHVMAQKNLETLFDHFPFLLHIVLTLSQNKDHKISMECLELLRKGLTSLVEHIEHLKVEIARNKNLFPDLEQVAPSLPDNQIENWQNILTSLWLPVLNSLTLFHDNNHFEIQIKAMEVLFMLMQTHGVLFAPEFWKSLCDGILLPFLEKIINQVLDKTSSQESRLLNTGVFNYFVELVGSYFEVLQPILWEIIGLTEQLIIKNNEYFVKIALRAIQNIVQRNGKTFTDEVWLNLTKALERFSEISLDKQPKSDFNEPEPNELYGNQQILEICVRSFEKIVNGLNGLANKFFTFSFEFNKRIILRFFLWQNGFQKDMKQLPGLIKPERDSLSLVCLILYKSYLLKKTQHQDFKEEVSNYIKKAIEIINNFLSKQEMLFERISKRSTNSQKKSFTQIPNPKIEESLLIDNTLNMRRISMKAPKGEEDLDVKIINLSIFEEERELINLRSTLAKNILPTLNLIEISDFGENLKDLMPFLISISKFSFSKCYSCSVCQNCQNCGNFIHANFQGLDFIVQDLLLKISRFLLETKLP